MGERTVVSAMLGMQIEKLEKPKAKERQRAGGGDQRSTGGGKVPPAVKRSKTRDVVGESVGMSGKTFDRGATDVAPINTASRDQMRPGRPFKDGNNLDNVKITGVAQSPLTLTMSRLPSSVMALTPPTSPPASNVTTRRYRATGETTSLKTESKMIT